MNSDIKSAWKVFKYVWEYKRKGFEDYGLQDFSHLLDATGGGLISIRIQHESIACIYLPFAKIFIKFDVLLHVYISKLEGSLEWNNNDEI